MLNSPSQDMKLLSNRSRKYGYHLVKVNNKRPARGEMEAAHIFVPVQQDKSNEAASQKEIRRIYKELQGGMKFADAAGKYSQDKGTKGKGGSLGIISIKNKLDKAFEETIFRLKADGDFSQPFRSSVGWHIVQRVKKRELGSLDQMRRGLRERIKRDSRFKVVQERFVERIKKENNFVFNVNGLHKLWAFKSQLTIPVDNIINAHQDLESIKGWQGWRMPGIWIPYIITAGTFYKNGDKIFWDVVNVENCIIVELKDEDYKRLIIEVENPLDAIKVLTIQK